MAGAGGGGGGPVGLSFVFWCVLGWCFGVVGVCVTDPPLLISSHPPPPKHHPITPKTIRETARLASRLLDTLKRLNPLESAVADARFLQPLPGGGGGVHEALRGRIQAIYQAWVFI